MGLIAFGIVSTLGLLPVGLSASRDAIAESYAADSADMFLHYLSAQLRNPQNDYGNWALYGQALPESRPGPTEPTSWSEWHSDATSTFSMGGSGNEYYKVMIGTSGAATHDFAAIYRVWREPVIHTVYEDGSWIETELPDSEALALNIEVSWPASLPYERRYKSQYRLEVFKPQ